MFIHVNIHTDTYVRIYEMEDKVIKKIQQTA